MPLYIDEMTVAQRFAGTVGEALLRIREMNTNQALNPDMAVTQIRQHLGPLFSPEHQDVLENLRPASWSGIHYAFLELMFRSKGVNSELVKLAAALQVVFEHSISPARQLRSPKHVEVFYFFHIAKLSVTNVDALDQDSLVRTPFMFTFCKYCWRQSIPLRSLCPLHASGKLATGDPDSGSARYKSGQRRRAHFQSAITSMVTAEVMEFHKSEFQADILFTAGKLRTWLEQRRPLVWSAISQTLQQDNRRDCIHHLVDFMYDLPDVMPPTLAEYEKAKVAIQLKPLLAWPIVTRMEAYLHCQKVRAIGHGGKRAGAGRKPSPPSWLQPRKY